MSGARLVLFLALRQLWDRKLLNGIAVGGVALGVLVLIGMNGIMQGFQMKFKAEVVRVSSHITIFDKELWQRGTILEGYARGPVAGTVSHERPSDRVTRIKRPRELVRALEQMEGVVAACGLLTGQAILSLGTKDLGVDLQGIVPDEQERCTPIAGYVQQGRWSDLGLRPDSVVLGSGVASDLGAHVGDRLRVVAPGGRAEALTVVALWEAGIPAIDKTRIYVNLTMAQSVLHRPNVIGTIDVRLRDADQARAVAARIEALTGYDSESWQEANANFLSLFDMQTWIVAMVITAILVVGGFGILAIQIMIVLQKTRDIAILRSIGLRRADVLFTFLVQGVVVSLVGAAIGDLLGWRLVEYLSHLQVHSEGLVKSTTFLVYKNPRLYAYGALFALLTGVVASLLPAWRGSRVEPVDVLRGQIG